MYPSNRSVQRSILRVALILSTIAAIPVTRAQEAGKKSSEIRDKAGLFAADAIARASVELDRISRASGAAILIETIDTLKGEPPDRVAVNIARHSGIDGVFILIARKEHKLEALASRRYREVLTEGRRNAIREAFFEGFKRQDFNEGLKLGVDAIGKAMASVHREEPSPRTTAGEALAWSGKAAGPKADSPLIVRDQVRLSLAGARAILAGAVSKARAMGLKENIAVVDEGGHLIAFERMDGARPASIYTAMTKATTAATMRQPSGPIPPGVANPDPLLNLGLEHAAMSGGGKLTTLLGGLPVLVDGQVIGGVGVGGGTGEQDAQVAQAGIQALTDQLATPQVAPARNPDAGAVKAGQADGTATKTEDADF